MPQKNEVVMPPEPPEDWECCGSECGDACVHELYRLAKQQYDAQQQRHDVTPLDEVSE